MTHNASCIMHHAQECDASASLPRSGHEIDPNHSILLIDSFIRDLPVFQETNHALFKNVISGRIIIVVP